MEIKDIYKHFLNSSGISTDTRTIKQGNIYFALKGPSFNGNRYAADALSKGATLAVVDERAVVADDRFIYVEDVLTTLQQLANYHRHQLKTVFIGVCGSNGKTTTKELIYAVLNTQYKTFATIGNLNNHIGVPLTLLSISADTEYAIIEMGANHLQETSELCHISEPDYGIITNNGYDHLEGYGSLENVRKANGELYDFLLAAGGTAFVNADDNELMQMSSNLKRLTYGTKAEYAGEIQASHPYLTIRLKNDNTISIATQLAGDYNFPNVMCAVAIGMYFKVSDENIQKGIGTYLPKNNRSQLLTVDTNTFIVDCYNANPSSMEVSLKYFSSLPSAHKVAILGDMFELGDMSADLHKQILILVHSLRLDDIILIGKHFAEANRILGYTYKTFENTTEAKTWFKMQFYKDATILLKGSRGMALETLLT